MTDAQKVARRAAEALRKATALVVTAGAGMGVDSGLPDFRGAEGFWNAYPLYRKLGLDFVSAANPVHFQRDPAFGWGFYGHRAKLYRETEPHAGFGILLSWARRLDVPFFVVTSNVDGQFQKAGFPDERVLEIHGSIHHLQCLDGCSSAIWGSSEDLGVDPATMRARKIPRCVACGGVARPNVLMFGDFSWVADRTETQEGRYAGFLRSLSRGHPLVVELGAGTAIPSIRQMGEALGERYGAVVLRVNPREPRIASPHLSMACGALEALQAVDGALAEAV